MKITKTQYPSLVSLMQTSYPDYKGRKFFIQVCVESIDTTSYWDSGSRTYFKFIRSDGKTMSPLEQAPWKQTEENRTIKLQQGLACVTRAISCGYECGLTMYLHPSDMPKRLTNEI